jgi:hypothetical protein
MVLLMGALNEPSGHVFRVERAKGPVWYAKYRLPDGKQVQRRIGPAWADRGRPPAGYFTKRTAEGWLHEVLTQARLGTLVGMRSGGATFAEAAAEWLRFIEQDRERKPSTVRDYRNVLNSRLLPAFGERQLESITRDDIESWRRTLHALSARSKNKLLVQLHGIFRRAQTFYGLHSNPLALVEKHPSKSSRPRRYGRSSVPPTPRRMALSSSQQPSRACGWVNCARCAGERSTSQARLCVCGLASARPR